MSKLSEYINASGGTQRAFAERIGVSSSYLSELIGGKRPSLAVAVGIERETGGAVPATSWIPSDKSPLPGTDLADTEGSAL